MGDINPQIDLVYVCFLQGRVYNPLKNRKFHEVSAGIPCVAWEKPRYGRVSTVLLTPPTSIFTKKRREAPSFTAGMDRCGARGARCPSDQSNPGASRALNGRGEHGGGGPVLQGGEDVHYDK